jgi:hypothetical protein
MRIIAIKRPPRVLQSALGDSEPQITDADAVKGATFSLAGRIAVVGAIVLALIILAGGIVYWIKWQRYPVVVTIGVPGTGTTEDPFAKKPGPLVPITPEMLRVSSIALGNPPLTIVNGKRLGEGEWLVVPTALGDASVGVIQIEDGVVRFRHGGETISAKLQIAEKTSH